MTGFVFLTWFHGSTESSSRGGPERKDSHRTTCSLWRTCGSVSLLIFLAFVFTAIALSLHGIKKRRKESRAE